MILVLKECPDGMSTNGGHVRVTRRGRSDRVRLSLNVSTLKKRTCIFFRQNERNSKSVCAIRATCLYLIVRNSRNVARYFCSLIYLLYQRA